MARGARDHRARISLGMPAMVPPLMRLLSPLSTPLLLLLAAVHAAAALPAEHAWGCLPGNISAHMKFCDVLF